MWRVMNAPVPETRHGGARAPLHDAIHAALRDQLATGALTPGQALSLRRLALELGGSITPVRDAVWRLAAERALEIGPTRRIRVPVLTADVLDELMATRALLEPEAARRSLSAMDAGRLAAMRAANAVMNDALMAGDVAGYMAMNHAFHFTLYRARPSEVLVPALEAVWVRTGPFMRLMFADAAREVTIRDRHLDALDAIEAGDADGLAAAIAADVADGRSWMLRAV